MNMKKKNLSVVIVGTGDMGAQHAVGWKAAGCKITGVVDIDVTRRKKFQKEHKISKSGSDYKKLIKQLKPDVVSVCVPAFFHPEVTVYAAESGCHVFCEKPIALTIKDAQKMINACKRHKKLLGIGFQRRFMGDTIKIKELAEEGILGRPLIWKALDLREVRPKIMMHSKKGNGGSIVDCAVHSFDQWRYVFNSEPVSVYACGGCFGEGKKRLEKVKDKALDTGVITVKFASGDIGEITIGWGFPERTPTFVSDMLMGPLGVARQNDGKLEIFSGKWAATEELSTDAREGIMIDFVEAIISGKKPLIAGEDGLAAIKVALAALESIETGKLVNV